MHGLFGRGRNFTRLASGLKPEFTSLLLDLPNHGASAWTEHFSYVEIADAVADELRRDFAAAGPIDVVGHSMGGKVAMQLALRHPQIVRRLAVLDISPLPSPRGSAGFTRILQALQSIDLATCSSREQVQQLLSAEITEASLRGFLLQNLQRTATGFSWQPNLRLLSAEIAQVMDFPPCDGAQFLGPVLWLRGANSDYVDPANLPLMRELFPAAQLLTVPDSGHWVHAEQPEFVLQKLRNFLDVECARSPQSVSGLG